MSARRGRSRADAGVQLHTVVRCSRIPSCGQRHPFKPRVHNMQYRLVETNQGPLELCDRLPSSTTGTSHDIGTVCIPIASSIYPYLLLCVALPAQLPLQRIVVELSLSFDVLGGPYCRFMFSVLLVCSAVSNKIMFLL